MALCIVELRVTLMMTKVFYFSFRQSGTEFFGHTVEAHSHSALISVLMFRIAASTSASMPGQRQRTIDNVTEIKQQCSELKAKEGILPFDLVEMNFGKQEAQQQHQKC